MFKNFNFEKCNRLKEINFFLQGFKNHRYHTFILKNNTMTFNIIHEKMLNG